MMRFLQCCFGTQSREQDLHMSTGEITRSSSRSRPSGSSDDPGSSERPQDLLDHGPTNSVSSDGTSRTFIIAIAVKAHEKMRLEPFAYAFHQLTERQNCKVVVICCLSRVRTEMGVDIVIDDTIFGGISKKKLEGEINRQRASLNHFLGELRKRLGEKGVELAIQVSTGRKSDDILVKSAKTIHPDLVVLDESFSGHQRKIKAALDCNLVLLDKKSKPLILKAVISYMPPVQQINNQSPDQTVEPQLESSSHILTSLSDPPPEIMTTTTSESGPTPETMTTTTCLEVSETRNTTAFSTNAKTGSGFPMPPALSPTTLSRVRGIVPRPAPQLSSPETTPNPMNPATSLGSGTPPCQANQSISVPLSEPIPYEVALARAIEASIRSAAEEGIPVDASTPQHSSSRLSAKTTADNNYGETVALSAPLAPSAPPLPLDGGIQYPGCENTLPVPKQNNAASSRDVGHSTTQHDKSDGLCVVCWEALAEAVCIPCGHLAGCMDCLNGITSKRCPVCRASVNQVLKVYTV